MKLIEVLELLLVFLSGATVNNARAGALWGLRWAEEAPLRGEVEAEG